MIREVEVRAPPIVLNECQCRLANVIIIFTVIGQKLKTKPFELEKE